MYDDDLEPPPVDSSAIPYTNFGTVVGDDYDHCDHEILHNGQVVRTSPVDKETTEKIVKDLRSRGYRVDWHWLFSRAVVKCLEPEVRRLEVLALFNEACTAALKAEQIAMDKMSDRHDRDRARISARLEVMGKP